MSPSGGSRRCSTSTGSSGSTSRAPSFSDEDEGGVRVAFAPDFYLPLFDVYVEVTTLRQKLVTKKNRKIRMLRARYPEIRLVVLYQRDMAALLAREAPGALAPAR